MIITNTKTVKTKDIVEVKCDDCEITYSRTLNQIKSSRRNRKSKNDYCPRCARLRGAQKRPQNTKEFWAENKQGESYYEGIKNRPSVAGEKNPMWGRQFSPESKAKRSKLRKKRTGEKAPNWKGGKSSINKRVKGALQRKYKWFHRVMDRDNCTCQHCGATKQLDAHHIEPISKIIKGLLESSQLLNEKEKIDWLIVQPEIVDNKLTNGITLCRICHRKVHKNWGSHEPKVQQRLVRNKDERI